MTRGFCKLLKVRKFQYEEGLAFLEVLGLLAAHMNQNSSANIQFLLNATLSAHIQVAGDRERRFWPCFEKQL